MNRVELHVNIDHVATVRQARGTRYPDPLRVALLCELAGADGITVHLREDRRHAQDEDVARLKDTIESRLNLEMAATEEMTAIAIRTRPDLVTLVPERRAERTTEGGLDVIAHGDALRPVIDALAEIGVPVSLFIDPDRAQIDAAVALRAAFVELHTGDYADAVSGERVAELKRLAEAGAHASQHPGLGVAAGHGLTVRNVGALVQAVPQIEELNIGHALISDAIFVGIDASVAAYRAAIDDAESRR